MINSKDIKKHISNNIYAIDDEDTFEVDDAISIEYRQEEIILWSHISCIPKTIEIDSQTSKSARNNSISLYMITDVITMFSEELVRTQLSLDVQKKCSVISYGASINEAGEIHNIYVEFNDIVPTYRLTYEEADELIDYAPNEEKDLYYLLTILKTRREFRLRNKAINVNNSYSKLKIKDNILRLIPYKDSESRFLVSECMILAGTIASIFANNQNIPFIYRAQKLNNIIKYSNKKSIDVPLIVGDFLTKSTLNKAYYAIKKENHDSLGLNSYSHITSPIRRYIDYINNNQIYKYLRNMKIMSSYELEILLSEINLRQKESIDKMRNNSRNLINNWLKDNGKFNLKIYFLRWLSSNSKIALAYFIDYNFEHEIILSNYNGNRIGMPLTIRLEQSNDITIIYRVVKMANT